MDRVSCFINRQRVHSDVLWRQAAALCHHRLASNRHATGRKTHSGRARYEPDYFALPNPRSFSELTGAGFYVWKFEYDLPKLLPPSWASLYGNCSYAISVAFESSQVFKSKGKKQKFRVVAVEDKALNYDGAPLVSRKLFEGNLADVVLVSGCRSLFIGKDNVIVLKVKNNSNQAKQVLSVYLECFELMFARGFATRSNPLLFVLATVSTPVLGCSFSHESH